MDEICGKCGNRIYSAEEVTQRWTRAETAGQDAANAQGADFAARAEAHRRAKFTSIDALVNELEFACYCGEAVDEEHAA